MGMQVMCLVRPSAFSAFSVVCVQLLNKSLPSVNINHLSNSVYTSNIVVFIMHYCYSMLLLHAFFALLYFLPRDASAERGNATVTRPSVCL